MSARKRRRADGSLRPTVVRRRKKNQRARRREWLANFAPGERDRFFHHVVLSDAVYLAAFQKETGLPRAEAAELLERTAKERRWRKLRTLDGTVVGIAPPRTDVWAVMGGDTLYAERGTRAEAEALVESDRHLVEKFGPARVERRVQPIRSDEP